MRVAAAAVISGILVGLSQPLVIAPLGAEPIDPSGWSGLLVFVAMVPLLLAIDRVSVRRAWLFGSIAGAVQMAIIAHWVVIAFSVFGGIPLALGIAGMIVCAVVLGLLIGLAWALTRCVRQDLGWPRWAIFPPALAGAELLRNVIPFGGDPWGNVGMSLARIDVLRQPASVVGVYGLVFLIALVNALIADAIEARRIGTLSIAAALLAAWFGYGAWRLRDPIDAPRVRVAILQGSVPQQLINDPQERFEEMIAPYRRLQAETIERGADLVIWPEMALYPFVEGRSRDLSDMGAVAAGSRAPRAAVIGSGAIFRTERPGMPPLQLFYNSAFVLGPELSIRGRIDKLRLVPFGEYVPWPLDRVLEQLATLEYEVLAGEAPRVVALAVGSSTIAIAIGGTICWDGVFPEISRAYVERGAELMFNLSNDGWYGVSSAPHQHLDMYRMRATETARSVARGANTGISAAIDPRGRVLARTELFETTALIAELPIVREKTPVQRWGEWPIVIGALFATGALIAGIGRRRQDRLRGRGMS